MTPKEELHRLVDDLPESETHTARRFLEYLCDVDKGSLARTLYNAPEDDEPETPEEAAAIEEARQQLSQGDVISDDDLWRRLGHEPRR